MGLPCRNLLPYDQANLRAHAFLSAMAADRVDIGCCRSDARPRFDFVVHSSPTRSGVEHGYSTGQCLRPHFGMAAVPLDRHSLLQSVSLADAFLAGDAVDESAWSLSRASALAVECTRDSGVRGCEPLFVGDPHDTVGISIERSIFISYPAPDRCQRRNQSRLESLAPAEGKSKGRTRTPSKEALVDEVAFIIK